MGDVSIFDKSNKEGLELCCCLCRAETFVLRYTFNLEHVLKVDLELGIGIYSCEEAAFQVLMYVCPSMCRQGENVNRKSCFNLTTPSTNQIH